MKPARSRYILPPLAAWALLAAWAAGPCRAAESADPPAAAQTPAPAPADADIQRLIDQLGDSSYYVRERAQANLQRIGFRAFDALSAASLHDDFEIATRAHYVLERMMIDMADPNDPAAVKPLLAGYEGMSAEEKLSRMKGLADLPDGAGWPALVRLVRYERSTMLSKRAAIELLRASNHGTLRPGKAMEAIRALLPPSPRPAARWLVAWADLDQDPKAALARLGELIAAENQSLRRHPGETSREIITELLRFQFQCFKRQNMAKEAVAVMHRLIELEPGDPTTLGDLLDWLIEQKAWTEVDALAKQFEAHFREYPLLSYALAQSRLAQGDQEGAARLAAEAFGRRPGVEPSFLAEHLRTAMVLGARGQFDWAVREYRHVIEKSKEGDVLAMMARIHLAELYHDRAQDREAGEQLEAALKTAERKPDRDAMTIAGRTKEDVLSRKHYFFAMDHAAKSQPNEQKAELLAGLRVTAPDIDLLIEARGLTNLTDEEEKRVIEKIQRATAELQETIDADPKNAQAYNEYAWLVGNTARDAVSLDVALKYSQQSLQIRPGVAGFYDTLAHVYFAKGDYDNAVHYQTKAAELEPHAGLITRKLDVFSKKLAEKDGEKP